MSDEWMKRSVCRTADPELFFTADEDHVSVELSPEEMITKTRFCDRCPVAGPCLITALTEKRLGFWGGTNTAQRRAMRRAKNRVTCLRCRSSRLVERDGAQICRACGISWPVPA